VSEEQPAEEKKKVRNAFTSVELADQVDKCAELLALGWAPFEIRRYCSAEWGLSTRVGDSRIHEARKRLVIDHAGIDRKDLAAQMLAELQNVVKFSSKSSRGSDVIGALRLMAELCQLNPKN
jgi:hypothetical protein